MGFSKGVLILAPAIGALYLLSLALTPSLGAETATTVGVWGLLAVMYGLRPLLLVGAQRFNSSRTSWNNLRFRFTGRVGDAYRLYSADLPRIIFTLGLYWSWHRCNVRRFRMQHTRMGDLGFGYRGRGGELFQVSFLGTLLCYLTLGIYVPWQIANVQRFHIENTTFRGHAFRSRLTGRLVLARVVPAMLAIVLTLGLAIPWALQRWYELVTNTTSYPEAIDPAELRSIHDAAASALVEGLGEAGDALAEIGDYFGG